MKLNQDLIHTIDTSYKPDLHYYTTGKSASSWAAVVKILKDRTEHFTPKCVTVIVPSSPHQSMEGRLFLS